MHLAHAHGQRKTQKRTLGTESHLREAKSLKVDVLKKIFVKPTPITVRTWNVYDYVPREKIAANPVILSPR